VSNMREMNIRVSDLLESLRVNRETHRETFEEAQMGYREAMIEELDRMLADAKAGNSIRRMVTMPEPQDHTSDYDVAIRMLEMCVDDVVEITVDDFERLVMDEWGWKTDWVNTTSNYTARK